MNAIYSTQVTARGGRDGFAKSNDGKLEVKLALPKELGGNSAGTNPEQLFAAGYSACFESAIRFVARGKKLAVSSETTVTAEVGLLAKPEGGFKLLAALKVKLPEMDRATAEQLVAAAHQVCPYSNATRGNLDVQITLE